MTNNTLLANKIRQSVMQLSYRELQTSLRAYRDQGLTTVKLNAKKAHLQAELCLILYRQNNPELNKPNHLKAEPEPQPEVDNEYLALEQAHREHIARLEQEHREHIARLEQEHRERMQRYEQVRLLPIYDTEPELDDTEPEIDDTIVEHDDDDSLDVLYQQLHPINNMQVIKSKRDEITAKVKAYLLRRIRY